jgi:hypothetical protein
MNSLNERAKGFATLSDYPTGLMNMCPCGQVVLAPALHHEGCDSNTCGRGHTYLKAKAVPNLGCPVCLSNYLDKGGSLD